ncbi:general substrate transporter [Mycena maculata]|uniref:General substrate transporter n=1 Tax=Mycena maculata TaxID=230809 RepID=A0AAD7N089_9AGAR|nr:general substrate transporter [Mycena maculata]
MVPPIIQAMRSSTYTVRYSRRWTGHPLLYISGAMASLGDALFGYSQGVTAAFQVQPNFIHRMYGKVTTIEEIRMRKTEVNPLLPAIMVACLNITALFAALGSAYLSDYLGRRISMRIGAFIYVIASIIQMFATDFATLMVGRMIQGLGTGILSTTVPIYQCEIAPANRRGMFISLESLWMNAGYALSSWIGYAFFFDKPAEGSWRGPYAVQLLISLILFVGTFYLPETARWLIQNGFKTEGLWTLADLHAKGDVTDESVNRTYYEIVDTLELEKRNGVTAPWRDLFKEYTRRTIIGWTAQMFAQLNGINALLHFLPETLTHAGFSVPQALFYSSICSFFYLAGTVPAILYVDKLGRRRFLLVGSVALAASLTVVGSLKLYIERWPDKISVMGGAHGVVVGMSVYFFFFACTWGPIPWLLSAELFPLKVRAKGMAITTVSDWLFEFLVAFWTPPLFEILRGAYYFLLVGCCIISGLLVWFVFVETGTETLEEIGGVFGDETAPPRVLDEDDLILNLRRRRARGHSTLSMGSQLTTLTEMAAASEFTLHNADQGGTFLHPHNDRAGTSQMTLTSVVEEEKPKDQVESEKDV